MDFNHDRLIDGRNFRVLMVVDQFTREYLILLPDVSVNGGKVAAALDLFVAERDAPQSITVDNGADFSSRAMDSWAYNHGIQLDSSDRVTR